MRKIPQNCKKDYPSPRSLFTIKPEEQFSTGVYGFVSESILLEIQYPVTNEDGFSYIKDVYAPANEPNNKPKAVVYRTTKEIADSFIEKEKNNKESRKKRNHYVRQLLEDNRLKYAKKLAMKARRREFASQRARLILIMIESGQDYLCAKCGTEDNLTVDHKYPLSRGGTDDPSNLDFLCQSCNSKKGAKIE